MSYLQAFLLGILQGIAEFLPISSSGHLAVAQKLFGLQNIPMLFDVMLHIATLLAVILVFRKRLAILFAAFGRWIIRKNRPEDSSSLSMITAIVVGTILTAGIGLCIEKTVADFVSVKIIGVFFIITAILLIYSSHYVPKQSKQVPSLREGIITGIAQGIGVLPGISRSGITISTAILTGINRETAGEYSFLLSIPAILGAFILSLKDADTLIETIPISSLIIGFVAAFVAGLCALTFLMKLIKKGSFIYFAWYLIPVGIGCIFFL